MPDKERFAITKLAATLLSVVISCSALTVSIASLRHSNEVAAEQLELNKDALARSGPLLTTVWWATARSESGETLRTVQSGEGARGEKRELPLAAWKAGNVWLSVKIRNVGRGTAVVSNYGIAYADDSWYPVADADVLCAPQAFGDWSSCGNFKRIAPGDILFIELRVRPRSVRPMGAKYRELGVRIVFEAGALPAQEVRTNIAVPSKGALGF